MFPIERSYGLQECSPSLFGLSFGPDGVALAGVSLLDCAPLGLTPRPLHELGVLLSEGYGREVDPTHVSAGLAVVAKALNEGDIGRAMVASVQLRLGSLNPDGAERISRVNNQLTKYDPTEPRDDRGRWTSGGGSPTRSKRNDGEHRLAPHSKEPHGDRPVHHAPQASLSDLKPRLIRIANVRAANDNVSEAVCEAASRQCQITALHDKTNGFFQSCFEAQDACTLALYASRLDPLRPFIVVFPDKTVVEIQDGAAKVTHISGIRLIRPLH